MAEEDPSSDTPEAPEPIVWFRWLLHHFRQEGAVIKRAPGAVLVTALVLSLLVYFYLRSSFSEKIESLGLANATLQATIQFQNERIADYKDRLDNRNKAPAPNGAPSVAEAQNKYVCSSRIEARNPVHKAILIELGVRDKPSQGLAAYIALSGKYLTVQHWEGPPLRTDTPSTFGGSYGMFGDHIGDQTYTIRFASPNITPEQSEYFHFESESELNINNIQYLANVNSVSDPLAASRLATQYSDCPRK